MLEKQKIITSIAGNVRRLMNQAGMSSTELAKKANVSSGTISKIIHANMSITVPMAMALAQGLGVSLNEILNGLVTEESLENKTVIKVKEALSIGVMSINGMRVTCIKNNDGHVLGTSELEGGLDLAESTGGLIQGIRESVATALSSSQTSKDILKASKLNLVMQSYEFEDTRARFVHYAGREFDRVVILPDWQITYMKAFGMNKGISLVTEKGVSLSYRHNDQLKKIGGWKFPVYDLGGENWLGVETIKHTIEAFEGFVPMSKLAHNVLAKFNGKIERITEVCFKGSKDTDIYSLFTEMLLYNYFIDDDAAKDIIKNGFNKVNALIQRADEIIGKQVYITLNGSLSEIYRPFLDESRLLEPSTNKEKAELLAILTPELMSKYGVLSEE